MFKKIVYIILLITIASFLTEPAFALYWGIFDDYEEEIEKYAMYKVLRNIPIKYAVEILNEEDYKNKNGNDSENIANELKNSLEEERTLVELIELSFNAWYRDTKNMIIKEGRQEEFADILPLVSKRILLKKVANRENADLVFIFSSKKDLDCPSKAVACISLLSEPIEVNLENPYATSETNIEQRKVRISSDTIHELGHYFALSDQYKDVGNTSPTHSTFSRIGKGDSIMAAQNSPYLSCDDVDGFINLIDLTLFLENGKFSQRAQKGWASFCNGKKNGKGELYQDEFYREAKVLNKPKHTDGLYEQTFDELGNLKDLFILDPLDLYGKEFKPSVVGYDLAGEIVDKEHNRKYDCTYNHIKDGIIDVWEIPTYNKFKYIRSEDGEILWACDWMDDDISTHVYFHVAYSPEECRIYNGYSIVGTDKEFRLIIQYDQNNEFSAIRYDMGDISLLPQYNKNIKAKYPSYISLYKQKRDLICSVEEGIAEGSFLEFSLTNPNKMIIIKKDEANLDTFARKYNVSKNEVINNAYTICNNMKKEANKEKYKYKCNYFKKVEKFYQSRSVK